MNTTRKGSAKELRTSAILRNEGWLVASLRHTGCPGDLLAVKAGEPPRIIEVKARKNLYEGFRTQDRQALVAFAAEHEAVAECAYWAPAAKTHEIIPSTDWP